MLHKVAVKNGLGKMVFDCCSTACSDLDHYHILIISRLNSNYHMRKLNARKGSFEWRQPNFQSRACDSISHCVGWLVRRSIRRSICHTLLFFLAIWLIVSHVRNLWQSALLTLTVPLPGPSQISKGNMVMSYSSTSVIIMLQTRISNALLWFSS